MKHLFLIVIQALLFIFGSTGWADFGDGLISDLTLVPMNEEIEYNNLSSGGIVYTTDMYCSSICSRNVEGKFPAGFQSNLSHRIQSDGYQTSVVSLSWSYSGQDANMCKQSCSQEVSFHHQAISEYSSGNNEKGYALDNSRTMPTCRPSQMTADGKCPADSSSGSQQQPAQTRSTGQQASDPCATNANSPTCQAETKMRNCEGVEDPQRFKSCYTEALAKCDYNKTCEEQVKAAHPGIEEGVIQAKNEIDWATSEMDGYETELEDCRSAKQEATSCCKTPTKCVEGGQAAPMILQMITQVQGSNGGISAQCKAFQNMLTGNMAINGIGLLMCTSKRQTCEQTCTDLQAKFDMSKQRLATVCANKYSGLVDNNCSSEVHKAESNAKEAKKMVVLCDDLSNEQIGQGMQISALGVAQKLSGECSDATTEQSTDFPEYADTGNLFSGDCSNPAFFNHPTCIACRKDPSQASCKGLVGLSSEDTVAYDPGGDVQSADASSYAKDVGLNGQGDDDLDVGDPGGVAGAGAGLAQTASAGGGGGGLGGGSGIAALGTSGGGGGGSKKGYNTDILKGARGGGGYVSKMGFNSPSGYSSRGGSGSQAKRDSFNLKDFLPGGKKYKGKERGLASASGLVGKNTLPPSVNIFERLSHRFHRQCKKGTFLNCGPTYWENRRKTWHSGQQW